MKTKAIVFLLAAMVVTVVCAQQPSERSVHPWSLGWREKDLLVNFDFNENAARLYGGPAVSFFPNTVAYSGIHSNSAGDKLAIAYRDPYTWPNGKDRSACFWIKRGPNVAEASPNDPWIWGGYAMWVVCDTVVENTSKMELLGPAGRSSTTTNSTPWTWEHWAVVYSSSPSDVVTWYFNGAWDSTHSGKSAYTDNFINGQTGMYLDGSTTTRSMFDDIMVFNRALTSNEVARIYAEGLNVK